MAFIAVRSGMRTGQGEPGVDGMVENRGFEGRCVMTFSAIRHGVLFASGRVISQLAFMDVLMTRLTEN